MEQLGSAKEDLTRIARASLAAIDPRRMISRSLRLEQETLLVQTPDARRAFDLSRFQRILVLGFGKAAGSMAQGVEEVLGPRIDSGLIVVKPGREKPLRFIRQIPGGHPVPDEASERAAAQIAALADSADERTLVLVLISGGGSSLIAAPSDQGRNRLTLADLQETTRQLLACGAEISELNCIRKHLFLLAGGRLARRAAPAPLVGLVMSDVVGDDLQTISSGPACSDETTFDRALSIIDQYGLTKSLPANVVRELSDGAAGLIAETPKPASAELSRATNILVATNLMALRAAENEAKQLGYHPLILTSHLAGEAREVARFLAAVAKDVATSGFPCARPACILAGGETTVTVRGKGKGGRNQELALAFLREMQKEPRKLGNAWLLSFSTDGEDGPTDAAGGFASARMAEAARRAGLRLDKALHDNDSHTVLEKLEGLFVTGETDTNVADIQIIAVT